MSALVFGASGFLGSWTVRALLASGESVSAVSRSLEPWRIADLIGHPALSVTAAPPEQWADVVAAARPRAVVLADWAGVAAGGRNGDAQWANLERHDAIIRASVDNAVERVVGLGSQAEHGPRAALTREDAPLAPTSVYGQAKVAALDRLRSLTAGTDTSWVWGRVFSVYGPLDNEGGLLATIANAVADGRPVPLSTGEQLWSYLYASDAGRAIAALALRADAAGIVNIGHPEAPPLRTSIELFARALHAESLLRFGEIAAKPELVANVQPEMSRLAAFDWSPAVDYATGLAATAAWLTGEAVADPLGSGEPLPARPTALN